jgi:hypothetical protein
MKKVVYLSLLALYLIACNNNEKPIKETNVFESKNQINEVLDAWHLNAAETNFDAYFNTMASNGIFVGTDAAEVWTVEEFKDFSKPFFDAGQAWNFTTIDRNIYLDENGKIVWFDELLDTWMGVCRGSGVLKKIDNNWKIEHYVLSVTIPNDNIQEIVNINKQKDSLFIAKFKP